MQLRNQKVDYFDPTVGRVMICVETGCIGGKCSVVLCLKNRQYANDSEGRQNIGLLKLNSTRVLTWVYSFKYTQLVYCSSKTN